MNIVNLKGYKVTAFNFKAELTSGQQITLQNNCSYNVRYNKEGFCVGTMTCKLSDRDAPAKFFIEITVEGGFAYDSKIEREKIHVASFKELFPCARSIVLSTTALFGITPVMIPPVDIEGQNIYRIDASGLKQ